MENDKIVVGLDIGTTKICAIVGRKNAYGKLEVLGMGKSVSDGVKKGMVLNIDKTTDAIIRAVKDAEEASGVEIKEVNVGIAGQHIRSTKQHTARIRPVPGDIISIDEINRLTNEMYNIVVPPGNQIIHVMPQVYTVDGVTDVKDPVGMTGSRIEGEFHIITAYTNDILNINKSIKAAGLDIVNLILEPLASSMSVLSEEEKEAGVVLVDIGGGTTDVAIFHENIIRHTAVIPFGGEIITQDVKAGCSVLTAQAEQLKVRFGKAIADEASTNEIVCIPSIRNKAPKEISVKNLAHIIQCRMEEIIEQVHAEIIASGYDGHKLDAGIVVTGGGSQLQHITQLFEYITCIDTRLGYPNEHLGKSNTEEVKTPMHATGVGLVLAGFETLDYREAGYAEKQAAGALRTGTDRKDNDAGDTGLKTKKRFDLNFKGLIDGAKKLLMDDFDEKAGY